MAKVVGFNPDVAKAHEVGKADRQRVAQGKRDAKHVKLTRSNSNLKHSPFAGLKGGV